MLESLSTRLQDVFRSLRGEVRLSEASVDAALREIRLALLEADVNFRVVKAFIDRVRAKAIGDEVLRSRRRRSRWCGSSATRCWRSSVMSPGG